MKYNYTQQRSDYLTSQELLARIQFELNLCGMYQEKFDIDVCCSTKNIPAKKHYIEGEYNGLELPWGKLNYCNPPFKKSDLWVKKARKEMFKGNSSVLLIPARTERAYWQKYILCDGRAANNPKVIFLQHGYGFLNPDTREALGAYKNPLAIVIFKGMKNED
ncbi:hypothetical protein IJ531_05315 [bacterium]|nr:hypothetical protein [bacterium]